MAFNTKNTDFSAKTHFLRNSWILSILFRMNINEVYIFNHHTDFALISRGFVRWS